jgi:hypothetical protein
MNGRWGCFGPVTKESNATRSTTTSPACSFGDDTQRACYHADMTWQLEASVVSMKALRSSKFSCLQATTRSVVMIGRVVGTMKGGGDGGSEASTLSRLGAISFDEQLRTRFTIFFRSLHDSLSPASLQPSNFSFASRREGDSSAACLSPKRKPRLPIPCAETCLRL